MKTIKSFLVLLSVAVVVLAVEGSTAGVKWTVPASWKSQAERPMRVATYDVPAAAGAEAGECGVFYFGQGQGGNVEDNLSRWIGQFEGGGAPKKGEKTVHGLKVHTVDISGTYLASGGPMMKSQGKKPATGCSERSSKGSRAPSSSSASARPQPSRRPRRDFDNLVESVGKAAAAKL